MNELFDPAALLDSSFLDELNQDDVSSILERSEIEILNRSKEDVFTEVMERFRNAESYRKQYDEIANRCYSLYRVYKRESVNGRSNLHIPRVYEQVDTIRARLVKSFSTQRPYAEFIPKVKPATNMLEYEDNLRKADIASALVDMQLESNNFKSKTYDFMTSLLLYPAAIMGIGWKYDEKMVKRKNHERKIVMDPFGRPLLDEMNQPIVQEIIQIFEQKEVAVDDNEIINIDFYDFWPDPKGQCIDTCRYVFHREWLTREDIQERIMVLSRASGVEPFTINWDDVSGGDGLEDGRGERLGQVGFSPGQTDDSSEHSEHIRLYEVLNYWEDERYAMIINRKEVIYYGPNPYWRHMSKPFVVASFEPLPNEFYGMSAVELVADLQEETNTHRNQRIDNVSMTINKMWKVRRDADIDESELVSRPHGVIHVDSPDDITEFQMSDVTGSSYNEEQLVKLDMENTLGVPSVVRGVDSSRRETATEIVTKSSNAGIRFDVKIMLLESVWFKRLVRLMDLNNQQFIDGERLINLVGGDGVEQWRMVTPDSIIGEFDYRPAGPSIDPAANKEMRRQQITQLYMQIMQTQNPYIDHYELTKTMFEENDLRNADKLVKSKEQVMQEQQMAQLQAMMAQGQLPPQAMMGAEQDVPDGIPGQLGGMGSDPEMFSRVIGMLRQME